MQDISVHELSEKIKSKDNFILIDVRESYEHTEFNIGGDLASLQTSLMNKIHEMQGKENEEIVVYCKSGSRSGMAKQLFAQAGFKNVRNLIGGMLYWREVFQ